MANRPRTHSPPPVAEAPSDVVDISFTFSNDADEPLSETQPRPALPRRASASTSSFLHPDTTAYLKPRTPGAVAAAAAMADANAPADGVDADADGPFNFQTQFMSTTPVKSVRDDPS
jgi:hypothetical protein